MGSSLLHNNPPRRSHFGSVDARLDQVSIPLQVLAYLFLFLFLSFVISMRTCRSFHFSPPHPLSFFPLHFLPIPSSSPHPCTISLSLHSSIASFADEICLCSGEKDQGIIAVITVGQEPHMEIIPDMVIKGRAVCMKYISSCDMVLIGTLDFYVYAVDCFTW